MKRLTMRSSSEWKVTTTSRPPGFSARSAANSAFASSPSSSLTKMRSAWNTRVAGWILSFGLRPTCASIASARSSVPSKGLRLAALLDHPGDAAGMAFLAEEAEDAGEIARLEAVDDVGGAGAGLRHAHVERSVGAEGEAACGLVDLHRRDADVEHHAVDLFGIVVELRERPVHKPQPAVRRRFQLAPGSNRVRIAVDRRRPTRPSPGSPACSRPRRTSRRRKSGPRRRPAQPALRRGEPECDGPVRQPRGCPRRGPPSFRLLPRLRPLPKS